MALFLKVPFSLRRVSSDKSSYKGIYFENKETRTYGSIGSRGGAD